MRVELFHSKTCAFIKKHRTSIAGISCAILFLITSLAYCKLNIQSKIAFFICVLLSLLPIALYAAAIFMTRQKSANIAMVFLLFLCIEGLMFCFLFTPFSIPDEPYHYLNAYSLANRFFLSPDLNTDVLMRASDSDFYNLHKILMNVSLESYKLTFSDFNLFSSDNGTVFIEPGYPIGKDVPQLRIPAAIGIVLGRLCNLGPIPTFFLGRLANFAIFAVCAYFAVRITPIGKRIFIVICMLPMTIHLAASYSYDAVINGLAILLISIFLAAIMTPGKVKNSRLCVMILLSCVLAPCKIVYAPICALVFLIPAAKFSSKRIAYLFKLSLLVAVFVSILIFQLTTIAEQASGANVNSHLGDNHYFNFGYLVSHPLVLLKLFAQTFGELFDFYIRTIIGASLAWFQGNISAPTYITVAYFIIIYISILNSKNDIDLNFNCKIAFVLIAIVSSVIIFLALATGWTYDTENKILGVQGRYFIPVLPLILLTLIPNSISISRDFSTQIMFALTVVTSIYLMVHVLVPIF